MNPTTTESILVAAGFQKSVGGMAIGESCTLDIGGGWSVSAYCGYGGNLFDIDRNVFTDVKIHLHDMVGTSYVCLTESALESKLPSIIATLKSNAATPDLLKCPKCKAFYVSPKTPPPGQKWKPFLSCKGMMITGKNKTVMCDGISKALPAVVIYK
jgi:hypothetical protein